MVRRKEGDETWNRLLSWTKGQKSSERLAGQLLRSDGFKSVDPSHPLGGKDGLKDILMLKDNINWIASVYFPRGQKTFQLIKEKFIGDAAGIKKNKARGMVFITNQELKLSERKALKALGKPNTIEIYHLEMISGMLDYPENYGVRLDFLDIELTKEEQLSFFAKRDERIFNLDSKIENFMMDYNLFKRSIESQKSQFLVQERTEGEILKSIDEFFDKIWYERHQVLKYRVENKSKTVDSRIWETAKKAAKDLEIKYGVENMGPNGDFEWGMINGKLSALRWVLGDEWDMLDT